ncbi:MAG: peptide chain release factor N(5)-glutamine methyltransferase [Bacteroidales bacterium]
MKILPTPLKEVHQHIIRELSRIYSTQEAQSISFLLIEHLLNYTKSQILLKAHEEIDTTALQKLNAMLEKLKAHEPLQYVIGEAYFYEHRFKVAPGVLIPRSETEELVVWIQEQITPKDTLWDIGTGSGCIPISVAHNQPEATYYASDISRKALKIAKINNQQLETNVQLFTHNILEDPAPSVKASIIVSNPPYITLSEQSLMHPNVLNFEPDTALFVPDSDPLLFYRAILENTIENRHQKGTTYFFEINEQFGQEMIILMEEKELSDIELRKDLHGKERMIKGVAR